MPRNQTIRTVHFTSIKELRNSHAEQGRVTRVANNLKRLNSAWSDEWFFPAVAVGLSNGFDDVSWVESQESVQLNDSQKNLNIGGAHITFDALLSAMDTAGLAGVSSRADVDDRLSRIDAVLAQLAGKPVSWSQGVIVGTEALLGLTAGTTGGLPVTMESLEDQQTPVTALIHTMHDMEVADIMAAITAVNSARGGLLKGAQPEELTIFIRSMTGNQALNVEWPVGIAA